MPKNEIKEQFEEKYNLYGDMLYKIAYLYLGKPADAEDALQEVFIKLLSRTLPFKNSERMVKVTILSSKETGAIPSIKRL